MNGSKNMTPEEKLLHIIEKPAEAGSLGFKKSAFGLKRASITGIFKKSGFKKITLQSVNMIIMWIAIVATATLIIFLIKGEKILQTRFATLSRDMGEETLLLTKEQKDIPELQEYLAAISKNNPFHVLPTLKTTKPEEEKKVSLKLVGIIWSKNPQAIIEDDVSKKNYLVYKGDSVDKFKVTDITKNEVRLSSEDEGEKVLR